MRLLVELCIIINDISRAVVYWASPRGVYPSFVHTPVPAEPGPHPRSRGGHDPGMEAGAVIWASLLLDHGSQSGSQAEAAGGLEGEACGHNLFCASVVIIGNRPLRGVVPFISLVPIEASLLFPPCSLLDTFCLIRWLKSGSPS